MTLFEVSLLANTVLSNFDALYSEWGKIGVFSKIGFSSEAQRILTDQKCMAKMEFSTIL